MMCEISLCRPMPTDFVLVPRYFADRYFSAVSAFHSCDVGSWPPREPWWQPQCNGNSDSGSSGFEESILFRHLHATDVAYRQYPMFDYCGIQQSGTDRDGGGSINGGERSGRDNLDVRTPAVDHGTVCILMGAAGLFRSSYSRLVGIRHETAMVLHIVVVCCFFCVRKELRRRSSSVEKNISHLKLLCPAKRVVNLANPSNVTTVVHSSTSSTGVAVARAFLVTVSTSDDKDHSDAMLCILVDLILPSAR